MPTSTANPRVVDQWFNRVLSEFSSYVLPLAGRPIIYVEIGVWGGAASQYVCRNVLTHPESIAFGIDPYDQSQERSRWDVAGIKRLAAERMEAAIGDRYQWIYEPSRTGLETLKNRLAILKRPIDLLYVDGQHGAMDVLFDFVQAWPMLRPGSIVIFDDYCKIQQRQIPHVRHAVAAIEIAFRNFIKPISLGASQYVLEVMHKTPPRRGRRVDWPRLAVPDLIGVGDL